MFSHSVMLDSATPWTVARQVPLVRGDSPGKNTGVGCRDLLKGNLPNPQIEPRFPALQADSLLSEPPGKPENTGVGCHVLLLRDLPNPGIEPRSPALQADSLPVELSGTTSMLFSRIISNTKKEDSLLCLMTL